MQDLSVCICVWRGSVRGKLDNVHKQVVFKVLVVCFFVRLHPRPQTYTLDHEAYNRSRRGKRAGVYWRTIVQQDAEAESVKSLTENSRREVHPVHSLKTPDAH